MLQERRNRGGWLARLLDWLNAESVYVPRQRPQDARWCVRWVCGGTVVTTDPLRLSDARALASWLRGDGIPSAVLPADDAARARAGSTAR